MRDDGRNVLADVIDGAIAGALATWVMGKVTTALYAREDADARHREDAVRDGKTAYGVAAEKLAGLAGTELTDEERAQVGARIHWGLGAAAGAVYGLLRPDAAQSSLARGLTFGGAFWLLVDEGANAALGLTPGPRAFPWQAHARGLAGHLVFGAVAEAALGVLQPAARDAADGAAATSVDPTSTPLPGAEYASGVVHERRIGGIMMRWEERGAGVPVVLVHGIPTSPRLWRRVLPRLRGTRALAWEMVGYGTSIPEGQGRDLSVAAQADYLLAWMDALGIERAVLAGHDLGGGVVQILATRHPDRCAGLLLTNCICYDSWPIPEVELLRAAGPVTRHLPDPVTERGVFGMLMRRGHDDQAVARESRDVHWTPYAAHGGASALIRQMRALDVDDTLRVAPELPRLRGVPARVIWGAADPFQKVAYGERLARDLGTALERIEGGKHFTPEDHPGVIADAITALARAARA